MGLTFKMATDIPASVLTPDSVATRLGTLRFFDGFPDEATVQKVYDNLDFQRGVQAYLAALPAADMCAMREGYRSFGPVNQTLLMTESLTDARTLYFLANTETVYSWAWLDTKAGAAAICSSRQTMRRPCRTGITSCALAPTATPCSSGAS